METSSKENLAHLAGFARLAAALPGKVFVPGDSGYEEAWSGWNRIDDKCPGVVVLPETPGDVVAAVSFAHHHGLPVAVQATGHRWTGDSEGAVLINTAHMKGVRIDPQAQTARIGAGVEWGEVLQQAQAHGLGPLLGSSTGVGAVGYSLSGGMGWLARKYGLNVDSILNLEVVTPDGIFQRASLEENSDLFWALRGGGGGFGVVTAMEIRLYPVSSVYAGNLFYPARLAKDVFRRYRQWAADAPEELTCSIVLMNFPPVPQLPPVLSGQSFVIVRGCYAGPAEDGQKLVEFWRNWLPPVIDDFKAIPFTQADGISMDPVDPSPSLLSGEWLSGLTDEAADALIRYTLPPEGLLPQGGPPAIIFSEVRLAGGAIARVDPDANAYSHRAENWIWYSLAVPLDAGSRAQIEQHFQKLRAALAPSLTGKVYPNFLEGDEMRRRSRDAYSEQAFHRLQAVKAKYDPDYRFISSFDIPPYQG